MKKKFISIITILTLLVTMAVGCGTSKTAEEESTTVTPETTETEFPMKEISDELRVMIVGSGTPQYEVGRGQPSVLVQYKDKYFLVDCGNRTVDTLLENGIRLNKITNILFTHQHFDHNADFWDVFMGGSVIAQPRQTLTLVGPDVTELFNTTTTYYKDDIDQRIAGLGLTNDAAVYGTTLMEITENTSFELDGVKITTMELPHGLTNYAYKFEAGGKTIVISGDFLNAPELSEFAKNADVFVVDASLTSTYNFIPEPVIAEKLKKILEVSHATAEQVESIVANSGAKKTVLTHLGGDSGVEETTAALKALGYEGEVIAAEDGLIIEP